jgi:hypothetical protein
VVACISETGKRPRGRNGLDSRGYRDTGEHGKDPSRHRPAAVRHVLPLGNLGNETNEFLAVSRGESRQH